MKTLSFASLLIIMILATKVFAQEENVPPKKVTHTEKYGNALNLGIGMGYYGYAGRIMPVIHADYEFDIARSFTLAPFIDYYSYRNNDYWGDPHNPYRYYSYHETVIPIGVKGTYYFDKILGASPKWDFYLAGSLGFAVRTVTWESGYYGKTTIDEGTGVLYLDFDIGAEYHFNRKTGIFLDLSTGVSTLGVAFHM